MSQADYINAIRAIGAGTFVDNAHAASLARPLASALSETIRQSDPERLPRLASVFELNAINQYAEHTSDNGLAEIRQGFSAAFQCWEALSTLPAASSSGFSYAGLDIMGTELAGEPLLGPVALAFRIAVNGTLALQPAQTRLVLRRFADESAPADNWRDRVLFKTMRAVVYLVRKQGGWSDIDKALNDIDALREEQSEFEARYLNSPKSREQQTASAIELVGLYHTAQLVTICGTFLVEGSLSRQQIEIQLARHRDRAIKAFHNCGQILCANIAMLTWGVCRELCQNAIWTHLESIGEQARTFTRMIAARGRANPVIELWPSQQQAFRSHLLDPYKRAVLVQMPTSAGKTLLAKFSIVQVKALNPSGTIAYVVPTRALVNQLTLELRGDFTGLGFKVEQAVPSYELNPTESALLADAPDILVTTPEKLDLLIKGDHPAAANLAFIIADEAHNVGDGGTRGARLELLLGTIKRERPNARFLLLSPFLPNAAELAVWLGEDRGLTIQVDWQPSEKLVGAVRRIGGAVRGQTVFTALPSVNNVVYHGEFSFPVAPPTQSNTIGSLTRTCVQAFRRNGSVLVLCRGRGTATGRAAELAEDLPELNLSPLANAFCHYLKAEIGDDSILERCVRRGVAYHHSGLSHESRWLVERLIANGDISTVCGTTTLAQGMNFPIRTVIVETLKKGDAALTHQDFWNIAGRAGRALVDPLGLVVFPAPTNEKLDKSKEFLRGEAEVISSQLAEVIEQADQIADQFNLATVRRWPQLAELMRFLAHALRVAGHEVTADEMDDILRSSLVFHQAQARSPTLARDLSSLCRRYLESLRGQSPGVLTLADKTGFATPSVLALLGEASRHPALQSVDTWQPGALFGSDLSLLAERIELVAEMPEMSLGLEDSGPFSPSNVAGILRDWVQGVRLQEMADRWAAVDDDPDKRLNRFCQYLFSNLLSQVSWGLGALGGICLAGQPEEQTGDAGFVPSMVFYGVGSKEAVWLRMAGMPRLTADSMASVWPQSGDQPQSFTAIRQWIDSLDESAWNAAIPSGTDLSADDLRLIWQAFRG